MLLQRPVSPHINVLNLVAQADAGMVGGMLLSASQVAAERRRKRKLVRYRMREQRHASWPHCGKRQRERYGRQAEAGRLKRENGLAA